MRFFAPAKPKPSSGAFPVDPVQPAQSPIWSEPLRDHASKRFRRPILALAEPDRPVVNAMRDSLAAMALAPENRLHMEQTLVSLCHPLVDAVGTAFGQHYPLLLSPDSIWLAIEQGFSHHIAENAEALRHRIVRHQGKLDLHAKVEDLGLSEFQRAIELFSIQIRDLSDPVLFETLLCDFSTTTPAIRTASEVVLMDCYSSYFAYQMTCVCGIPKITLSGTVDDWRRIRARIEVLETFGLDWWVTRLRPILDEFVRTAEGYPSLPFWQAIYKPKQTYGTKTVTGWIADLFPYLGDRPRRGRNPILNHLRRDWILPVDRSAKSRLGPFEPGAEKGIAPKSFPSGLASAPVKLNLPDRSSRDLDLVAGFLGVEQDPQDLTLAPVIGWSVAERPPASPVWI